MPPGLARRAARCFIGRCSCSIPGSTTTSCRSRAAGSRQLRTAVAIIAFMSWRVGLNMVVGYAGLLDLGYVAFYAIGGYVAGWFASHAVRQDSIVSARLARALPGRARHPHLALAAAAGRAACSPPARRADRPADAAPARRLPGDRDARLRRDHPAVRAQRRQHVGGFNLTNGFAGHHPDRPIGLRHLCTASLPFLPTISPTPSTRPGTTGVWRCSWIAVFCRSGCAIRASGGPGSRSARTRTRRPRWACR